jgi:hypothetical protein
MALTPTPRVPWYVWTSVASVTSILIGGYWDISWHMTIGRDTFWTPAHIAIQLGGIIAGTCGAYLIVGTTLGRLPHVRPASVSVWGFRGPLGAFIAVWGAAAMLISAPFDNWWHDAYGLDVKILSPPHMVLTIGILGVASGAVLIITASLNRAQRSRALELALLLVAGEILVLGMTAILEHTFRSNLHRADAYRAISIVAPLVLFSFARATGRRWAATIVATTYTTFMVAMLWLFPLFPAEPKLGPVYQSITHFIPEEFPMLIVFPAIACDLILARTEHWRRYARALLLGPVFLLVLLAFQWPFADFLMTDYSKNWIFGTHYQPYFMRPEWTNARGVFLTDHALVTGLLQAAIVATLATYLGMLVGDGLRKVKR